MVPLSPLQSLLPVIQSLKEISGGPEEGGIRLVRAFGNKLELILKISDTLAEHLPRAFTNELMHASLNPVAKIPENKISAVLIEVILEKKIEVLLSIFRVTLLTSFDSMRKERCYNNQSLYNWFNRFASI